MNPLVRWTPRRTVVSFLLLLALSACGGDDGSSGGAAQTPTYGLSGTVGHLDAGGLTISDGGETIAVAQGATDFAFAKPLANGTAYAVTVATQPSGQSCVVANGSGTVAGAAVANVAITCSTVISQPLAIGVSAANNTRIFVPVQVGAATSTINAIVDTGSAGTLIRAQDVFPSTMVSTSGFVFPTGQTSITYNGVTVTNVIATRNYGGQSDDPTQQTGNLGFAQMTFGSGTHATTAVMPILFVYHTRANGKVSAPTAFANLIGINPEAPPIIAGGVKPTSSVSLCTPQSTTSCGLASPFRYLSYASGVDKGFVLNKVTFASCDILTAGSCPLSPNLTLGVTAATLASFSTTGLSSCASVIIGTGSEPACSQNIPSVMVSSGTASFTGPAIFDSGAPTTRLVVPSGMSFPDTLPDGSVVRVATASGFAYQFTTGGDFATVVQNAASSSGFTNSGIRFFGQNSLLVDYSQALEGWHNG